MGRALSFLSFVAVLLQASIASQAALDLLSEEENGFHQRRLDFDDWCKRELESQEKQRKELAELQGDQVEEPFEDFEVSEDLLEIARQLSRSPRPELRIANVTFVALKALESDMLARSPRFFFSEQPALQAVQKLLKEAQDKVHGLTLAETSLASLAAKLEALKAEQKNASEVLAAQKAKALAAHSGRKVLETALAQTEASLSEAAGLCGLGRAVLNRSEATGQMLTRKALELVGMVEGSPAAPNAPNAPEIESKSPVVTPSKQVTPVAPVNSDLMALSRQLQLQQQQVQQQLEELKRIKSEVATPRQVVKAPEVDMEALQAEEQPLQPVSNKSPARKRSKGATMSLAAEAVEASHEGSHVRAAKSLPQTPAPTLQTALPDVSREKSDAKSKEAEEDDSTRLQAPKDFPAALRGGWQALLAKKRAEGVKKTPKAEEHSTSIMDLMQTPKTYTAWQPDKSAAQPAEKAKEDLLAAEKAFDDDEDSERSTLGRKKSAKSFLQLDGDEVKSDIGGADPLAFFQLGSIIDGTTPTFAAPSSPSEAVSLLLDKFAQVTNSTTLLELAKSNLQSKDFESLLQKLQAETDEDKSQEFCKSLVQKEVSAEAKLKAELKKDYLQAKVIARERLVFVFGNTSRRFAAVQELLQKSFGHEEGRLQQLEAQLIQMEATKSAHSAAQELHSVLEQLKTTMKHAQEELEDTLADATSRQQQAEKLDQQSLQKLVAHVNDLERSHESRDSSPEKLEKLCAIAAESRAQRQEKHQMEVEALRASKALSELL